MKKIETGLHGLFVIEPDPSHDDRGFFTRTWCADTFAQWGLASHFNQSSVSFNLKQGTVRGMHFQADPHGEVKLVRCTQGAILDVVVDVRPNSPTRGQWFAAELNCANRHALYIPRGFAHGFQTLADETEVLYNIEGAYVASAASGFRFDDPSFAIDWPLAVTVISDRDQNWPDFQ
jgi:dTDP-4-dehydrorhamnose 3,5-epimerase